MLVDYSSTPDCFTLIERRTLAVVVGGMFLACGIVIFWSTFTDGGTTSDYVFAVIGTVLGVGIIAFWPRRAALFDRRSGTVRLTTRAGAWAVRERVIPLDDVVGVVMQYGIVRAGQRVYDPALVLRSGERVPLVINATGFRGLETGVADAVRAWLARSLEAPLPL